MDPESHTPQASSSPQPNAAAEGPADSSPKTDQNSSGADGLLAQLKSRYAILAGVIGTIITAVVTLFNYFDTINKLSAPVLDFFDRRHYLETRLNPFPTVLDDAQVSQMSSGEAAIALMQIRGYLGQLKDDKPWKKYCITKASHPGDDAKTELYLNTKYVIEGSRSDQQNISKLLHRIDAVETSGLESSEVLKLSDPFDRLLERSKKQLLSRYEKEELQNLDKSRLYLLRNAIYGRHKCSFGTPKLQKFMNRRGWSPSPSDGKVGKPCSDLTAPTLDECNVQYLKELFPEPGMGALGRGVSIKLQGDLPETVRAQACACLSERKIGIECYAPSEASNEKLFKDYVDLIIEIYPSAKGQLIWTLPVSKLQNTKSLREPLDLEAYNRSLAASNEFSAQIQETLDAYKVALDANLGQSFDQFRSVAVGLPPQFLQRLQSDARMTRSLALSICKATQTVLDAAAP